jgi:hypothetical protein
MMLTVGGGAMQPHVPQFFTKKQVIVFVLTLEWCLTGGAALAQEGFKSSTPLRAPT